MDGESKMDEGAVLDQVKMELQLAYLQEFYETVRDKCFEKCVTKPSSSLSNSEQRCLSYCFDRYAEATQKVQKSILEMNGLE